MTLSQQMKAYVEAKDTERAALDMLKKAVHDAKLPFSIGNAIEIVIEAKLKRFRLLHSINMEE